MSGVHSDPMDDPQEPLESFHSSLSLAKILKLRRCIDDWVIQSWGHPRMESSISESVYQYDPSVVEFNNLNVYVPIEDRVHGFVSSPIRFVRNEVPRFQRVEWSKKQKRAYHRLLSGIKRALARGQQLRFLTLTSSEWSVRDRLNANFEVLRKRIEHKFKSKIQYWKIRTNEGFGVLHVIFKGCFLPQSWLSSQWMDIHRAPIVDVRSVQGSDSGRGLAYYVVGHYLSHQSFERMSWSWGWVFKGFVSYWKAHFVGKFPSLSEAIGAWDLFLSVAPVCSVGSSLFE